MLHVKVGDAVERVAPAELLVRAGSTPLADAEVALDPEGPFERLASRLGRDGRLRDALARGISIPSLRHHDRLRLGVAAAALGPAVLLLELDRDLLADGRAGAARIGVDVLLAAFVGFELSHRTPRAPAVATLALAAFGLRWALVAARTCGHGVHLTVYAAAAVAIGAALVLLARAPAPARVALEIGSKLGIDRSTLLAADHVAEAPSSLVAAAIACAAGLPAMLHLTRALGGGHTLQAVVLVAFAALAPPLARRTTEPRGPSRPVARRSVLPAIFTGLALTAGAVTAGRLFLDTGTELARCVRRLDAETALMRAAESAEVARALATVRASPALLVLTALVFPIAEERVYRGLLLDVLVRRYGRANALLATSVAFGLAHVGIYEIALYQTVLVGIGFGLAYLEGGLWASIVVHVAWNVLQIGS